MVKLTKYIVEQIGQADELERVLLPGGGGSGESNPITEAKKCARNGTDHIRTV